MKRKIATLILFYITSFGTAHAIDLQNPGFEDNPPTSPGNNIGHPITPWVFVPSLGVSTNVVKQDGDVTITGYGQNGPHEDASSSPPGTVRHYLDFAGEPGLFYQSFVSNCTGNIQVGGNFSNRDNTAASAEYSLREGLGATGALVGPAVTFNLGAVDSATSAWTPSVSGNLPVQAGSTYSFVISMDDFTNFDEAIIIQTDCAVPAPAAIPTLSQWSLILLSLLLAFTSFVSIRRKKRF